MNSIQIKKRSFILVIILIIGALLRLYRLSDFLVFFGDIGWYYLSAKDMLLSGNIPLVGITASHTWLHQGAYWTYILGVFLLLFKFNPVAGGYAGALLGIVTIWIVFVVGSYYFSRAVGSIAALLYATSPLVIIHSRMPYHTSPIPLFILCFLLFVFLWIKKRTFFFPLSVFTLGILYNFELATQLLWVPLGVIVIVGYIQRKTWTKEILTKRILFFTFILLVVSMFPVIIYDFSHGFVQTVVFGGWIIIHALQSITPFAQNPSGKESYQSVIYFAAPFIQRLIFLPSFAFSLLLFFVSVGFGIWISYRQRKKLFEDSHFLFIFFFISCVLGFVLNKTGSEAYLPMLFPFILILLSLVIERLLRTKWKTAAILILILICTGNVFLLVKEDYLMGNLRPYGPTMSQRMEALQTIIQKTDGKAYNLIGEGPGSQFASYTMNYQYLAWWLGRPVSVSKGVYTFTISDRHTGIVIKEKK